MVKKSCFDACSTCNLHTIGRWVPRSPSSPPGYRLNYSLWASLGLSGPPPTSSSHYGLCDDVMANLGLGPRPLYEWEADACELPRFDVAHACAVLEGKQVVVAGDSTAGQLFLSLVMQLGGRFGRNSRHTSAISDLSASACSGATRLVFVRNDLLLWSTHRSEFNRARECDKLLKADGYVQRAVRDADYLVLQTGHHFPATIEAVSVTGWPDAYGFFTSSLNHTLSHLMRARTAWGHAPSSVAIMGVSIPVPGCSRLGLQPLSLADALAALAQHSRRNKYSPRWQAMPRINLLLQWLATAFGALFVDIAAPSAGWPGGMMARFTKSAGALDEDCLHSCLPGPVDTYARLLLELLRAKRALVERSHGADPTAGRRMGAVGRAVASGGGRSGGGRSGGGRNGGGRNLGGGGSARSSGGGGSSSSGTDSGTGRRFFSVDATTWLGDRNAGAQFESGCRAAACVRATSSHEPWWPFTNCSRRKYVTFCDGDNCQAPVRGVASRGSADSAGLALDGRGNRVGEAALRQCDRQGLNCHNLSLMQLRGAAAREMLR
jgi:hypothetical protein